MPAQPLIRCETHRLRTHPTVRADVRRTVASYRRVVRLLATVALTHWPELGSLSSKERLTRIEVLTHATKARPEPRYGLFARVFAKMPSYLRRAAINAALGAVSSFLSNYSHWLDDGERAHGSRPPRLGWCNVWPTLYGGNMILIGSGLRSVRIKLLGSDGQWRFSEPLAVQGAFKRLGERMELSPSLICEGDKVRLACPVEVKRAPFIPNANVRRLCAVDVGINTAATAAIVDSTGTVIARRFFTCGRHNDRRDALATQVALKQHQSRGGAGARVGRGFCRSLYRRIAGLSLQASRELATQVFAFAREHGAQCLVLENLKGWKPKASGKAQRKRFHRFQHRMLAKYLGFKAEEFGLRLLQVSAAGTSRWAFDGSGKLERDRSNARNATFASGKRYNADLNAAYNIAARGLAALFGYIKPALGVGAATGKSSGAAMRMPVVLADIWALARTSAGARPTSTSVLLPKDAPTTAPAGA